MRTACILALACASASQCLCQAAEPACDAHADAGDDRCQLLQAGIGVVARHADDDTKIIDHDETVVEDTLADDDTKSIDREEIAIEDTEAGWPNILKKITDAVGGVDGLEKDFEGIKAEAKTFAQEAHNAIKKLVDSVKPSMEVNAILHEVEQAYHTIYVAAQKFVVTIHKTATDFMSGVGKVVPPRFKSALNTTLQEITAEGDKFANAFKEGEDHIKKFASPAAWKGERAKVMKMVCEKVSLGLQSLQKKANEFAAKSMGLTSKGMKKDVTDAKNLLPAAIRSKIDEVLKEANDAMEGLEGSLGVVVKDLKSGVAQALRGHCSGLDESASARLEVGLLTGIVLGMLSLYH